MDSPLTQQVQALLAEIFQVPSRDISAGLAFGDLLQWDSMGHMDVMIALEERFGVEVNGETIAELVSIPAICRYLAEKAKHG